VRKLKFIENKFYRIWSSGAGGQSVFRDNEDRSRFLFLILYLQSPIPIFNTHWYSHSYLRKGEFRMGSSKVEDIVRKRNVYLISFNIFDSGFDILIKSTGTLSVSIYMQRVLTAYSKYFNSKYKTAGHVFNGPFKAELVSGYENLYFFSAVVNLGSNNAYSDDSTNPWSSYSDYVLKNRWGELLDTSHVLRHFKTTTDYRKFALNAVKKLK
jgi:hypothetical protein